jgi:hypothetical protein
MSQERFTKAIVDLVAKRAGSICSNPDCAALTNGPADDHQKSITVGEAAHIFGARPGSARFNELVSEAERGDITNAIWLCCTCHKLVDSDALQFPAELLFEWRRSHERSITMRLGKAGAYIRDQITEQRLEPFSAISSRAYRIVADKPYAWEYKLTLELLKSLAYPTIKRWKNLSSGFYLREFQVVQLEEVAGWHKARLEEIQAILHALSGIVDEAIVGGWGPPGHPGSEVEILNACLLFAELSNEMLRWEEGVRFAVLPSCFSDLQDLWIGIGGRMIEQLERVPVEMEKIFSVEKPTGQYVVKLTLDLPDDWTEKMTGTLQRALAQAKRNWPDFVWVY